MQSKVVYLSGPTLARIIGRVPDGPDMHVSGLPVWSARRARSLLVNAYRAGALPPDTFQFWNQVFTHWRDGSNAS